MAAENYHLKWNSHLSYLNSSVSTLYKNEKFADVILYSSSSNGAIGSGTTAENGTITVGISAHKFILSSCSQYFATMFETGPISASNGIVYIVLPPDLSHRAIQTLVQYMYSGEATVSNDILNEVLRGGEILKIRGLCRSPTSQHHHHQSQRESVSAFPYGTNRTRHLRTATHTPLGNACARGGYVIKKTPHVVKSCNSRYTFQHSQHQRQFRGLGASVMPKESPVIVKSPKVTKMNVMPSGSKHHTGITVNKEVAIDPDEKRSYQVNQHEHISSELLNEAGYNGCPISPESQKLGQSQSDELASTSLAVEHLECEYVEQSLGEHCEREEIGLTYDNRLRRSSQGEMALDFFRTDHFDTGASLSPSAHPQAFLSIKQEPADWATATVTESSSDLIIRPSSPVQPPKQLLDFKIPLRPTAVKLEAIAVHSADEEEPPQAASGYEFTRLECEICKKSFDDSKLWIRHLETHTVGGVVTNQLPTTSSTSRGIVTSNGDSLAKLHVPKKRRRISQQENRLDHVTLLCDLCSMSFDTPAEWVRHMNNQHTEYELAVFNSKKDKEQKTKSSSTTICPAPSSSSHQHQSHKKFSHRSSFGVYSAENSDRTCDICNKKFPSHSNMMMHKRCHGHKNSTASLSASQAPGGTRKAQSEQRNSTSSQALYRKKSG